MSQPQRSVSVQFSLSLHVEGDGDDEWCTLEQQNSEQNVLTALAHLAHPAVAHLALDAIFGWGFGFDGYRDALRAYARKPLASPPAKYLELARSVDWSCGAQVRQLWSIVLAGSESEADREMLHQALSCASEDFRDGPIVAASAFDDDRFLNGVVEIAMSLDGETISGTGEVHSVVHAFRNWIQRDRLGGNELRELLLRHEQPDPLRMRADQWINYVYT